MFSPTLDQTPYLAFGFNLFVIQGVIPIYCVRSFHLPFSEIPDRIAQKCDETAGEEKIEESEISLGGGCGCCRRIERQVETFPL